MAIVAILFIVLAGVTVTVTSNFQRTFSPGASCGSSRGVTDARSAKGDEDAGLVVTPDRYASDIACRVLADGGSAADAVVAAQFTLGLTEPQSSGPGGGAVAVYYDAATDHVRTWNAAVPAPRDGGNLTGVPQTPQLMRTMQDDYGVLDFDAVLASVAELAEDGFAASGRLTGALDRRVDVLDGMPWPGVDAQDLPRAGDVLTNPDYAAYLRDLEVTGRIEPEAPLCTGYRDHQVCGSGSTGTGMMVVGEALGILDRADVGDYLRHVVTEAERLALANGNTWMQDPEVDPGLSEAYVDSLVTDPGHLQQQADRIDPDATLGYIEPDPLVGTEGTYLPNLEEGTSQITVRDGHGSIASVTTTLHQHFGSGVLRDGYFLNNSLNNFSAGSKSINQRAPGVRPKTAMSPVIVFGDGEPVLALGSPGGGAIPSYVIKTIVGFVDEGMSARDAVDAPNYGATGRDATYIEEPGVGHDSGLSVISREGRYFRAEADERAGGTARAAG